MFNIFSNILKGRDTKIIISILWGIGLASLFRSVCKGRNCIVYKAPSPEMIKGKIFKFDNKCYNYTPRMVECQGENILPPEEFQIKI